MLDRFLALALAAEALLICLEGTVPAAANFLPLGGSHLAQMGFFLGLAIAVEHLRKALQKT